MLSEEDSPRMHCILPPPSVVPLSAGLQTDEGVEAHADVQEVSKQLTVCKKNNKFLLPTAGLM